MGSLWTINDNSCKERNTEMKKIYQNPEIKVVNIQTSHMMAGSPGYGGQTTQTSGNFAKGGMFWSDDEEYYEEQFLG